MTNEAGISASAGGGDVAAGSRFFFEGENIAFEPGDSIAAALIRSGRREMRETASGALRSIFCGMGVCQDCLVCVDGRSGQRACMTRAVPDMVITRQSAFPLPEIVPEKADDAAPAVLIRPDVLVIGGGPAGLHAALAAAEAGAEVVLWDERKVGGGQFYKQPAAGRPLLDEQQRLGAGLIARCGQAGVQLMSAVEIWGAFDGPVFLAEQEGRAIVARPKTAIIATGAYERPVIVPGWTLPGVMTTGAAQTLWRSYRSLAGQRVAIVGTGPLNLQVALELVRGGAEVKLVAERAEAISHHPLAAARLALAGPKLALRGIGMMMMLWRRHVPVHNAMRLLAVEKSEGGLIPVVSCHGETRRWEEVDALLMNEGFEPQNEILRLLGVTMTYDERFGHLRCKRDASMRTSIPGVFAVGDCCGLGGAPAAATEGRVAGIAAAAESGHDAGQIHPRILAELKAHRKFQDCLWRLYAPAPVPVASAPDETIICRCEEVTLGDLRRGMCETGGTHAGTIKRATRLGMGRCQGRYCGPVAIRLIASETTGTNALRDQSFFAPRVPLKPVRISTILAANDVLANG